jgi:hypothetical protein
MFSEVSQVQKDEGHMFSLICRKQMQKINIYIKANMIIYKLTCRICCNSGTTLELGRKREW